MPFRFTRILLSLLISSLVLSHNPPIRLEAVHLMHTASAITVPDDYPTIQEAIDAAQEMSTISVKPGLYNECLTITKPSLKIVGNGFNDTVISSTGLGHTIEIARGANNVTVCGFSVMGTKRSPFSGIYIRSLNNTIRNNRIKDHYYGIRIYDSTSNLLRNNSLTQNHFNLAVWGLFPSHFINDIDASNKIDDKPVYYLVNQRNRTISHSPIGYLALVNSSNITVMDLNLSGNNCGILLAYTSDCLLANVTASRNEYGLRMVCSDRNIVKANSFDRNHFGIVTISSDRNTVSRNMLTSSKFDGLRLSHSYPLLSKYSQNNTITENYSFNNSNGIYLEASPNNTVTGNTIINNLARAIVLDESEENIVAGNIIENNSQGVYIYSSNNNLLCYNSFIDNSVQVSSYNFSTSVNKWDYSYPSGGNLWTDYKGADRFGGPFQNMTYCDGIGDTSYIIDEDNQDTYPLMGTFSDFNVTPQIHVQTICNSSISDFQFNGTALSFNVTGEDDTAGFCRICIPTAIMNNSYKVFINGTEVAYNMLPWSNDTYTHLYFTYNHSTQNVVIISEFPSIVVLPLFMATLLLAAMVYTIMRSDGRENRSSKDNMH